MSVAASGPRVLLDRAAGAAVFVRRYRLPVGHPGRVVAGRGAATDRLPPAKWEVARSGGPSPYSEETLQFAPYLARWRADFDYVLLIDPTPEPEHIAKLSSLYDGDFAKLYRIDH